MNFFLHTCYLLISVPLWNFKDGILRIWGAPVCQNLGMTLGNKVVQKLKLEKNVFLQKIVY